MVQTQYNAMQQLVPFWVCNGLRVGYLEGRDNNCRYWFGSHGAELPIVPLLFVVAFRNVVAVLADKPFDPLWIIYISPLEGVPKRYAIGWWMSIWFKEKSLNFKGVDFGYSRLLSRRKGFFWLRRERKLHSFQSSPDKQPQAGELGAGVCLILKG
jgi:hypothetical protein